MEQDPMVPDETMLDYWNAYLDEFEQNVWPAFQARSYGKLTALQVYAMDQLDTTLTLALAKQGKHERA